MKKLVITLCLCLGVFVAAEAQQKLELTLNKALDIALSDNPTITVANLEVERYDYVRKQALSSLYPQIDASAQYALALRRQEMAQGLSFGGKNTFNVAGNVSLPLFVPSVYRQLKMTRTQMEMAVESARSTRIDLIAAVSASYYGILLAEQSLAVLEEAAVTTDRVVKNTEDMYKNGLAAEYDYITARVQRSNLDPQILQLKNSVEIAKLQLKMYLSIPESVDIEVVGSLDDFKNMAMLGADYEINLENNSTIKNLDLQLELLDHQEKMIQTTRMPTLAAFGQISLIGQERSELGGLLGGMGGATTEEQSKFWWQYPISVGAQLNIPIFAGLKKTNQLREVRNQREQLRLQRDYAEEGVRLQVQQSINTLLTARSMMLANAETVLQAEKAYNISVTRYDAGAGTILEVNSAQLSLTQAQLSYSQSIYDYLAAYTEYEKALGKDTIE